MSAAALMLALVLPATTLAAWRYFDPADSAAIPKKFSETGFYENWAVKTVTPEAHFYEVNSPLWSDFAHKYRWVILPAGQKITFNENSDYWDYPDSAVFVKLFKHETIMGDTASMIWWETRLLVNKQENVGGRVNDKWYGFSYKWRPDGSEAFLLPDISLEVTPDTAFRASLNYRPSMNSPETKVRKWYFPQRHQCLQCHATSFYDNEHARSILGFFTAQINRPSKANPNLNQIAQFFDASLLQWENKGTEKPTTVDVTTWPKWVDIQDASADVNLRARSYIAANCSGCHGERANALGVAAGISLSFDFWKGYPSRSLLTMSIRSTFGIAGAALIVPGYPERSILLHRQKRRNSYDLDKAIWDTLPLSTKPSQLVLNFDRHPEQMPPLGVYEEDTAATRVLTQWINQFKVEEDQVSVRRLFSSHMPGRPSDKTSHAPIIVARTLVISNGMHGQVTLMTVNGKRIPLQPLSEVYYAIPASLQSGLYVIRVGEQSFTRHLF